MISLFKKPIESQLLKELFQKERDKRSLDYESINIETSFGNTSILVTGDADSPPLVLVYGVNEYPPFALELLVDLSAHYRVYTIDGLEHSTLNEESELSLADESYGQWMYEVLAWLNIRNAIMMGVSFGGFVCCKTLLFDQRYVSKAFLVAPEGVVSSCTWRTVWRIKLPLTFYKWLKHPCLARQLSKALLGDSNKENLAFFSNWICHSDMSISQVPRLCEQEALRIKTPIFLVASGRDVLFPGKNMVKHARAVFPTLVDVLLLENASHIPNHSANKRIVEFVINHT
ncbi:MAG: alpha/beta hydrolase [Flavobacteriales bacterium]